MRVLKGVSLFVAICATFAVLAFIGSCFGGAGHGTFFFFGVLFVPFGMLAPLLGDVSSVGVYFCLWPAVGILLALRSIPTCRIAAAALLAVHYLGIMMLCFRMDDWHYEKKAWSSACFLLLAYLAVYVGTQVFIWTLILQAARKNQEDAPIPFV